MVAAEQRRLNFATPLPPLATEIANHSALVLPALAACRDVVAWTDQGAWGAASGYRIERLRPDNIPAGRLAKDCDSFYNVGNNTAFHGTIWEAARRAPGIVILHDTVLQHFFQGMATSAAGQDDYIALMRRCHGEEGERAARSDPAGAIARAARFPMTLAAVEGSRGVIVHNGSDLDRIRQLTAAPVWLLPLAGLGSATVQPACRVIAGPIRLIVFGHLGENRQLPVILDALATTPSRDRFRLDVYGRVERLDEIMARIEVLGLARLVTIHGYVPRPVLDAALATAELALNLRNPTMGEASSSQLTIWANSLPSLVTRIGWYASLPAETVSFVCPDHEIQDIQDHLEAFARDAAPYLAAGRAGCRYADQTHTVAAYVAGLVDIAAEIARPRPVAAARGRSTSALPVHSSSLDIITDQMIRGWTRGTTQTDAGLRVEWLSEGDLVAEAPATAFRDDVSGADDGDERYGFTHLMPSESHAEEPVAAAIFPARRPPIRYHLEVSDLIHYTACTSTVSGIQRVQVGYLVNWLADPDRAASIGFCMFSTRSRRFHAFDHQDMIWLLDSFVSGGDPVPRSARALQWATNTDELPELQSDSGSVLLVTGSFWSLPGFHAAIGQLRSQAGLHYVQLFYDAVPTTVPETCPPEAVEQYSRSIVGMLMTVDGVCAISHYAAGELRMLAARLGLPLAPIEVIQLGTQVHYGESGEGDGALPEGLGDFVLCVGTIEPRKNHRYLIDLWRRLLATRGRPVPRLVLAGRLGWMTANLQHYLRSTNNLDGHVVVLPDVTDLQLRALYRHCRFTIYPSLYEGWGLPVSESLSAGRLCVTSDVSSMPEAGEHWAEYLDPFNLDSGLAVVARLIGDPDQVRAKEAEIAASYHPISWAESADALWQTVERLAAVAEPVKRAGAPAFAVVRPGDHNVKMRAFSAASPIAGARAQLDGSSLNRLLDGANWNPPEDWGVWASGRTARLAFATEPVEGDAIVAYLRVVLPDDSGPNRCTILVNDSPVRQSALRAGMQSLRVPLDQSGMVRIEIVLDHDVTVLGDSRKLGLGLVRLMLCLESDIETRLRFLEEDGG